MRFENRVLFGIVFATTFLLMLVAQDFFQNALWILNGVNIALHEGGHVVFGILGNHFIMVAGGTLMQLLMPFAVYIHFSKQNQPLSADAVLFWFGENFIGIGQYMADARAQVLPLIGGGEHDWTYLLDASGLLTHDMGLGRATQVLGSTIMALALTLLFFGLWEKASSPAPQATGKN